LHKGALGTGGSLGPPPKQALIRSSAIIIVTTIVISITTVTPILTEVDKYRKRDHRHKEAFLEEGGLELGLEGPEATSDSV
jgi:Na+/alanine symporter